MRNYLASWSFWSIGPLAVFYFLVVEAVAVTLVAVAHTQPASSAAWIRLLTLLAMAVFYGEGCDRLYLMRTYLNSDGVINNHNSVLCFAGVLALPVRLAAALVIAVYVHSFLRSRRKKLARPYRLIFTAAVALISTYAAANFYRGAGGQLSTVGPLDAAIIIGALLLHVAVNLGVLAPGMYLVIKPARIRHILPPLQDIGYESATLVLGVLTAVVLVRAAWLSPLILVVVAVWHRASLVTQLQHTAQHDGKTGLLHAAAWREAATRHLARANRAESPLSLLVIDLDRFKLINDTHGHLVGDQALRAVAEVLRGELRTCDEIGRYGGEEFIALLPDVDLVAATAVAERLRRRIADIDTLGAVRVTASIGVSVAGSNPDLDSLIEAADRAMYDAKAAGRNRVMTHRLADPAAPVARPADSAASDLTAGDYSADDLAVHELSARERGAVRVGEQPCTTLPEPVASRQSGRG